MEGNRRNVRTILTHTGKIYVDIDNQLEFLTVGDYGKENNIKADFLGLTKEIHGVENTAVDLSKKWVATISTQKGCLMHCKFCDVPKFGFHGLALKGIVRSAGLVAKTIHPVVSTMLPKTNSKLPASLV